MRQYDRLAGLIVYIIAIPDGFALVCDLSDTVYIETAPLSATLSRIAFGMGAKAVVHEYPMTYDL